MSAVVAVLAGMAGAVVIGVLTSLLTKEAEGWIDVLPRWLLRMARRRMPASHRDTLYEEWSAELHIASHRIASHRIASNGRRAVHQAGPWNSLCRWLAPHRPPK
jgi:hypothetical protein